MLLFLMLSLTSFAKVPDTNEILKIYAEIQKEMASDKLDEARAVTAKSLKKFEAIPKAQEGAKAFSATTDKETGRKEFGTLSQAIVDALKADPKLQANWQLFYCPMVPKGNYRYWIQAKGESLKNPYFGSEMLECGVKRPWS